jgi:hypothetical protein
MLDNHMVQYAEEDWGLMNSYIEEEFDEDWYEDEELDND